MKLSYSEITFRHPLGVFELELPKNRIEHYNGKITRFSFEIGI